MQSPLLAKPVCISRLLSISSGEGTHVAELMRRTRRFLDVIEAEEAEKERQEMLRLAAAGGGGVVSQDEGVVHTVYFVYCTCYYNRSFGKYVHSCISYTLGVLHGEGVFRTC